MAEDIEKLVNILLESGKKLARQEIVRLLWKHQLALLSSELELGLVEQHFPCPSYWLLIPIIQGAVK
jgi:hypothetical protein